MAGLVPPELRQQYTCRRVPLAQRNAPQVGIFIAGNLLNYTGPADVPAIAKSPHACLFCLFPKKQSPTRRQRIVF
jgi:hypothetical protein